MTATRISQTEFLLDDMAGLQLDEDRAEPNSREDLYSHCKQRISEGSGIQVSRKAWAFRILFLAAITGFMGYTVTVALAAGDALLVFAMLMPVHGITVFILSWFFFKNKAAGKVPGDLVSVIIPVYNQEKLIEKVVDAIFASSYRNLEVVAVNDGSKDKTAEVLDALSARKSRLTVVHKKNGGKRTAVATGFHAARGNFVVLVDSDSIVDKYAIEEFMKAFNANPKVGGVVGNGKVLNADKNVMTKCQDVWYDFSFNIQKTAQSKFGAVTCLSGCLAAYRRETIADFMSIWAQDKAQYGDDRNLTNYALATPWARAQLSRTGKRLMKSMASYDDAEDRGLTSQTLLEWETIYVPTAVVYTEVPDTLKTYLRQQIRWRKGYLRSTFFASAFFWHKHPLIALLFYIEFMYTFIAPVLAFGVYVFGPVVMHSYWFPLLYTAGHLAIGLAAGLDYKFRDPTAKQWMYKPLMNMISAFVLPWVLFPALWGFKKNAWLTR